MMDIGLNPHQITLEQIKDKARRCNRLVYAFRTTWWKLGDPPYSKNGFPCGPRGELLMETYNPQGFIEQAESNPSFYGKHGLDAFVAAYHGNIIVAESNFPTSLERWDLVNQLLDVRDKPI